MVFPPHQQQQVCVPLINSAVPSMAFVHDCILVDMSYIAAIFKACWNTSCIAMPQLHACWKANLVPLPLAGVAESVFDQDFVQWLPGFVQRVQRLAMDGVRGPSGAAPPEASSSTTPGNERDLSEARQQIMSVRRYAQANFSFASIYVMSPAVGFRYNATVIMLGGIVHPVF